MKVNMQKWAEEIIAARDVKNLPVLFFPYLAVNGKKMNDVVKNPEAQCATMKGVIDRWPAMIAAMTSMDLTIEAQAFGCEVAFPEEAIPYITSEIAKDKESALSLQVPSVNSGRTSVFLDAAKLAAEQITDRPTFGGMLGPISLATVLMGIAPLMNFLLTDPETVHVVLDKCTQFSIEYAKAYKEAGANGIFLAEPTAGLVSPGQCEEFSSQYVKKLVDAVQDDTFFIILHNCGRAKKQVASMVGTGAKGYHFGNAVDMNDILPQVPAEYLVFGNIDPATVLTQGTPEMIRKETLALLEDMKPYPNFILSTGCDLAPGVAIENLDAYFNALEDFNSQNN